MKLLLDMNLSPKLAGILISKGIEAKHWWLIGASDAKDTEIMKYAFDNNYVVLTCDLDFSTILSVTHQQKPSVIQLRRLNVENIKIAEVIASVLPKYKNDLESGAILTIDTRKARLRLLPLNVVNEQMNDEY